AVVADTAAVDAGVDIRCASYGAGDKGRGVCAAAVPAGCARRSRDHPGTAGSRRGRAHQPGVNMAWTWFHRLGSPPYIYGLAERLTPWFSWCAGVLIVAGLYGGLVLAPPDYQQGDDFRIMYVHVPSAWMSLMVYTTMAVSAAVGLIWRIKIAHAVAASCAP